MNCCISVVQLFNYRVQYDRLDEMYALQFYVSCKRRIKLLLFHLTPWAIPRVHCIVEVIAMVFSLYKKQRILVYYYQGYKPHTCTIERLLREEGLKASKWGIAKFIARFKGAGPNNY